MNQASSSIALVLSNALALEMEMEFEFNSDAPMVPEGDDEERFVKTMRTALSKKETHNKTSVEKLARSFGIDNPNKVKELTELAIVLEASNIARDISHKIRERYDSIVELYKSQVNLSHRTSLSILMQQYSTAAPISFMAGMWVKCTKPGATYFEPSAGNGLLCHVLPCESTHVNELDAIRLQNLRRQPFKSITQLDASLPFGFWKLYDGVVTNPPFGDLEKIEVINGFHIKKLEHLMAIHALETMKDDGRAAIIIGGHTRYNDDAGVITNKGDRYFLNFLYHFYHVIDIIPIDGHKLYSRQGTAFDTRLILIAGRKETPGGIADYCPLSSSKMKHLREVESDFDSFYERVIGNDVPHFVALMTNEKNKHHHRFNLNDKVSFLGSRDTVYNGTVTNYLQPGFVEVKFNGKKITTTQKETNLVPELYTCTIEKSGSGYKAFKKLKIKNDKVWIARFVDGEELRIRNADNNREAKVLAVKERLRKQN
jgi:hypothetical protein